MKRKLYPSDLTDKQWAILAPLLPAAGTGGRPRQVNLREVLNAMFYILCGGCTWRSCCHTIFQLGKRSIIISVCGALLGYGSK